MVKEEMINIGTILQDKKKGATTVAPPSMSGLGLPAARNTGQQKPAGVSNDEWIKATLMGEATWGTGTGGHSKWGFNAPNPIPENIDQAVEYFKQYYLPHAKDYPAGKSQAMAANFWFGTGADPRIYMLDQYYRQVLNQPNGLPNRIVYKNSMKDTGKPGPKAWTDPSLKNEVDSLWNVHKSEISKDYPKWLNDGTLWYYDNIEKQNGQPNPIFHKVGTERVKNMQQLNFATGGIVPPFEAKPDPIELEVPTFKRTASRMKLNWRNIDRETAQRAKAVEEYKSRTREQQRIHILSETRPNTELSEMMNEPVPADQTFIQNANDFKAKFPGKDITITPTYNNQAEIDSVFSTVGPKDQVILMGHQGDKLLGLPVDDIAQSARKNISRKGIDASVFLGTCRGAGCPEGDTENSMGSRFADYSKLPTTATVETWNGPLGGNASTQDALFGYRFNNETKTKSRNPATNQKAITYQPSFAGGGVVGPDDPPGTNWNSYPKVRLALTKPLEITEPILPEVRQNPVIGERSSRMPITMIPRIESSEIPVEGNVPVVSSRTSRQPIDAISAISASTIPINSISPIIESRRPTPLFERDFPVERTPLMDLPVTDIRELPDVRKHPVKEIPVAKTPVTRTVPAKTVEKKTTPIEVPAYVPLDEREFSYSYTSRLIETKGYPDTTPIELTFLKGQKECDYEGCAEFVTHTFSQYVGDADSSGVIGDAWFMPANVKNSGGTEKFNIWDESFDEVRTVSELKNAAGERVAAEKPTAGMFEIGDITGIYNPDSHFHDLPLDTGAKYLNTHVGIVTQIVKGVPYITSNYSGNLKTVPYSQLNITSISSPRRAKVDEILPTDDVYYTQPVRNQLLSGYITGANRFATSMKKDTQSDVDPTWLVKASIAITKAETGFITNYPQFDPSVMGDYEEFKEYANEKVKGVITGDKNPEKISKGFVKFKISNLNGSERQYLGVNKIKDLYNPEKAAKATMYLLTRHYNYFDKLRKVYPEIGLTEIDVRNAAILSYNQGINLNASLGLTKDMSKLVPEELDRFRALYKGTIKDITSSKWQYVPIIGETMYDRENPEGHETYISKVNSAIEQLDQLLSKQ